MMFAASIIYSICIFSLSVLSNPIDVPHSNDENNQVLPRT